MLVLFGVISKQNNPKRKIYPVGRKYYTYNNNNAANSSNNNKIHKNDSLLGIYLLNISCYIINLCIVTIAEKAESLDFSREIGIHHC